MRRGAWGVGRGARGAGRGAGEQVPGGRWGQPRFTGARKLAAPSASGNLRLGYRAPGRGGRRALIPVKALPILLSSLGAFCPWEFRVFSTNLNILRSICSVHGYPTQCAATTSCPRSDRFWLCELRVSQQISTFYGSSVQSMGIQLNALPALPVRARTVSGCLNSAASGTGTKPPRSGNVAVTR